MKFEELKLDSYYVMDRHFLVKVIWIDSANKSFDLYIEDDFEAEEDLMLVYGWSMNGYGLADLPRLAPFTNKQTWKLLYGKW